MLIALFLSIRCRCLGQQRFPWNFLREVGSVPSSLMIITKLKIFVTSSTNNRNILEETDDKFLFPAGALKAGRDNVITVVQDNMGLNETDGCENIYSDDVAY